MFISPAVLHEKAWEFCSLNAIISFIFGIGCGSLAHYWTPFFRIHFSDIPTKKKVRVIMVVIPVSFFISNFRNTFRRLGKGKMIRMHLQSSYRSRIKVFSDVVYHVDMRNSQTICSLARSQSSLLFTTSCRWMSWVTVIFPQTILPTCVSLLIATVFWGSCRDSHMKNEKETAANLQVLFTSRTDSSSKDTPPNLGLCRADVLLAQV